MAEIQLRAIGELDGLDDAVGGELVLHDQDQLAFPEDVEVVGIVRAVVERKVGQRDTRRQEDLVDARRVANGIEAGGIDIDVVTVIALQGVVPVLARQGVVARAAFEAVIAGAAEQVVVALTGVEVVVAGAADQVVIAVRAVQAQPLLREDGGDDVAVVEVARCIGLVDQAFQLGDVGGGEMVEADAAVDEAQDIGPGLDQLVAAVMPGADQVVQFAEIDRQRA